MEPLDPRERTYEGPERRAHPRIGPDGVAVPAPGGDGTGAGTGDGTGRPLSRPQRRKRARLAAKILGGLLLSTVAAAAGTVFVLTNTDWGRERVRRLAVGQLQKQAHGIVRVGRLSGNLLTGLTVENFSITDSAGNPFIAAERVSGRYALRSILLGKRLYFTDVRLVRPVIVLDKKSGEPWNYRKIFPKDTTPGPKDTTPGFGDWIRLENVTLVDGRAITRTPWHPRDTLQGAARDSAIRAALAGETRMRVVRADTSFQKVSDYRHLSGRLPLIRIEDPAYPDDRLIRVATMRGIIAPFRPPEAEIRDFAGDVHIADDSIYMRGVRAAFPHSKVAGDVRWLTKTDELELEVRANPGSFADFRWAYPRFPSTGGGALDFHMHWLKEPTERDYYQIRNANVAVGRSRLTGDLGFTLTDTVEFHDTNVRVANFDTRLMEQLIEGFEMPRNGFATGRAAVSGGLYDLHLDADLAFDDPISGHSRAIVKGVIGFDEEDGLARAKDFRMRLLPAQVTLARVVVPDFPMRGTVTGLVTLNGTRARWLTSGVDVVHQDLGQRSHIVGRGAFGFGASAERPLADMDVDITLSPLALAPTLGRFSPAAGLRGATSGTVRLDGTLRDLKVATALRTTDGGAARVDGRFDLASAAKGYDARASFTLFNANALLARAPRTQLSGELQARGRGTDPQTMRARFAGAIAASRYGEIDLDSARFAGNVGGGLLRLDTLLVAGPGVRAGAGGTFGLRKELTGTISYAVAVDSLGTFRRWLPRDTGVVAPRPAVVARALERAKADSVRIARATEVERAATGAPMPKIAVDTPSVVPRDSLAGKLYAAGTARGTLSRFALRGRAGVEGLVYNGNTVGRGQAEYAWIDAPGKQASIVAATDLDEVRAGGFALDRVEARVSHRVDQRRGTAHVLLRQEEGREYAAHAAYRFHPDHREVHTDELRLRFDTTTWASAGPSAFRWGTRGIQVEHLDLRNGATGRVYANGFIPREQGTAANLDAIVSDFEIGDIASLAQTDLAVSGRLSVAGRFQGTLRDPRIAGAMGIVNPVYGGTALPDLRTRFQYAGARLAAQGEALRNGQPLASVTAELPVNLAVGATGPRVNRGAPLTVDFVADSLPLDVLPSFTDAVSNVHGVTMGKIAVRGTIDRPRLAGALALDLGSFRVVPTGTDIRDLTGHVHMAGDTIVVDSLAGYAGGGPVRLEGGIGIRSLTRPSFDLQLTSNNARLLDNDLGRARADLAIGIYGPFEHVYVNGEARVRSGVIYLPEDGNKDVISANDPAMFAVADTSLAGTRELLPAQSPLLENLRMDVALRVDRDTWVRSRDANVEIYSDGWMTINVDRAAQALAVEGSLNTERGEYTFMSKRFQIKRGSATFIGTPELNPTVQATAEYEVRVPAREALFIRLVIGGTARSLRLTLESDAQPPISQSDLLSYLAFGRSSSSLLQLGGSSMGGGNTSGLAGATAALATNQLAGVALGVAVDEIEGRTARSLGLDVFNITTADVQTELLNGDVGGFAQGTEVEAGRYWQASRWFTGVNVRPAFIMDPRTAPPGLVLQYRAPRNLRFEASLSPRYLLQQPTLEVQPAASTSVLGVFLIKEWRF